MLDPEAIKRAPTDHWSVTVERNGERVLTIESNCLRGRDITIEDEDAIRRAAQHLLSFIGAAPIPLCTACGKSAIGRCEATSSIYHRV